MQVLRSGNKTTLVIQDCVRTVAFVELKRLTRALDITVCALRASEGRIAKKVNLACSKCDKNIQRIIAFLERQIAVLYCNLWRHVTFLENHVKIFPTYTSSQTLPPKIQLTWNSWDDWSHVEKYYSLRACRRSLLTHRHKRFISCGGV